MNDKVSDEDARLGHEIAWAPASGNYQDALEYRIARALATVRKEARAAAFRAARYTLMGIGNTNPDPVHRKGFTSGINAAIQAIEAAANTEEGGGDG